MAEQPKSDSANANSGPGIDPVKSVDEPRGDSKPQADAAQQSAAPALSLPKGGGAISDIGEKFSTNASNGTASLTIPVFASPGRAGFGPKLSLSYDSGAGKSLFGSGWNVAVPAITRKTDKGLPRYFDAEESDVFILAGAEDLVPVLQRTTNGWQPKSVPPRTIGDATYEIKLYRPRVEGLYARIERWTDTESGETHWRSITGDNVTSIYGKDNASRLFDPDDLDPDHPTRIFSWLISESFDDKGNSMVYEYKAEDAVGVELDAAHERNRDAKVRGANRHVKRIKYGNKVSRLAPPDPANDGWLFELVFDYGEHGELSPAPDDDGDWLCRRDPYSSYRSGFELRTYRLCQRVLMFHHFEDEPSAGSDYLVRSTDLTYRGNADGRGEPLMTFVSSIAQSGYISDGAGGYTSAGTPALEFSYSEPTISDTVDELDAESAANLPGDGDGTYQWVDLDGEGISGVLTDQANAWFYKPNLGGGKLGPIEPLELAPAGARLGSGTQLLDLAGDGQLDVVRTSGPDAGFSERTADRRWSPFKPFKSLPQISWDSANLRFVDLSGDGHADVMITEDGAIAWHESLGEDGFAAEQRVRKGDDDEKSPQVLFADPEQTVYEADMTGDGLSDLVRIRNGEVSYWPNLGYGRFGARVAMDDAPVFDFSDEFDNRRLRLADIDGSGSTDLIYLAPGGVTIYANQCGNRWAAAQTLEQLPPIDDLTRISVADLLGNGTGCLVWSSPLQQGSRGPLRYVDLMGGQKPHLMVGYKNNLGREVTVEYASSTKFYLADKAAGRDWVTRLPFPVHVVERVKTVDRVSRTRFVSRSAYHHGYFDGSVEREFRGFGMVERWDTEEFAAFADSDVLPDAVNVDAASHTPPVLTRTWFHTGAFFESGETSKQFATEYWSEPRDDDGVTGLTGAQIEAMELPDTVLPDTMLLPDGSREPHTPNELETRELCRALRGSTLREEIYALDGSDAAGVPYSVSERNYTVELLQPQAANLNAVATVHAREQLDFHYERSLATIGAATLADPRVGHQLTLDVDAFGNVLRSVSIGYGRRRASSDPALEAVDRATQRQTTIVCSEREFTNLVELDDDHRIPQPYETRNFELINLQPASSDAEITNVFRLGELRLQLDAASDGAHELPFEDFAATTAPAGVPCRRPIDRQRTIFRKDDLSGALALGTQGARGLVLQRLTLALTASLAKQVFVDTGKQTAAQIATTLANAGGFVHSQGDADWWQPSEQTFYSPNTQHTAAQELAFAKRHFFGVGRTRSPLHTTQLPSETFVRYDDYDLLPTETEDAAGNVSRVRNHYRVLGGDLITDANDNRNGVRFDALGMVVASFVLGKAGAGEGDVFDDAAFEASVVDDPTSTTEYDLFAHLGDPAREAPIFFKTRSRERHGAANTVWQESYHYLDGLRREIQIKAQAEPGPLQPGGTTVDPRWVGTGWLIANNKGHPVRRYEPFFADSAAFEFAVQQGVSPTTLYDPLQRVVAVVHPNHCYEKTVFDGWGQAVWDVNDTVGEADPATDPDVGGAIARLPVGDYLPTWSQARAGGGKGPEEAAAAAAAAKHAGTPSLTYLDPLGRPFLAVADNGDGPAGTHELIRTRTRLDSHGQKRAVIDDLGRTVAAYDYDVRGNLVRSASMESGTNWSLNDVLGKPIRSWDSRGHEIRVEYDALRRPLRRIVRGSDAAQSDPDALNSDLVFERFEYGEGAPQAKQHNLRTRTFKQFDSAGIVTSEQFDFKGNLLRSSHEVIDDYKHTPDWSVVNLTRGAEVTLASFDALDRQITSTVPDGSVSRTTYNLANAVEQVDVNLRGGLVAGAPKWTAYVTGVEYDAKGNRTAIDFGNGARSTFEYDRETSRLVSAKTRRGADAVQDLAYFYDPIGNVVSIRDDAQQTIFFRNKRVEPTMEFTYDAIYRLTFAEGREHLGQAGAAPSPGSYNDLGRTGIFFAANDGNAMARYSERYFYDALDNIQRIEHRGTDPANAGWTRDFTHNEQSQLQPTRKSNRLTTSVVGGDTERFSIGGDGYDPHGNMLKMPQLSALRWDFRSRLQMTQRQAVDATDADGNAKQGERTYYVYDSAGERVLKVTELATGAVKSRRTYLGGYEHFERFGVNVVERATLHVVDGTAAVALVETRTDIAAQPESRYQFANHLGSATLELDDTGGLISYEEYAPYGGTMLQAVAAGLDSEKRFRYVGKERDEESGLYYFGARYYAPWLARWISCDPMPGVNRYTYADSNPIAFVDPDGGDPACAGQENCTLSLKQIYKINKQVIDKYGFSEWLTSQDAAKEAEQLRDEAKQANNDRAEAEEDDRASKPPTLWYRFKTGAKEKVADAVNWVSNTKAGKAAGDVNDSLKETAGNVGSELSDNTLGGIQRGQQTKLGPDTKFYITAPEMGKQLGEYGYEGVRDYGIGKLGGVLISAVPAVPKFPKGFKKFWNGQEVKAAEWVWKTEGKLFRREATIYLKKGNKMIKTKRRLDALLFDVESGEIEAAEWTTKKELANSTKKKAQLKYQQEIFDKVDDGWEVWAKPDNEEAYYDITDAVQRTGPYSHFKDAKNSTTWKK
ncbi:MAG: SpvB/TcaC N-terminal domain-containing protein [Solirubrobacterales bacterium]